MQNKNNRQALVPFRGTLSDFLGDFWNFPTSFDSHLWEKPNFMPSMDITENEKEFNVIADIPGFEAKDISIEIENDGLVIAGKHEHAHEEKNKNYLRSERSYGSFYRKVSFPSNADLETVKSKLKNGVLTITIPKRETASQKKTIKIDVE